jgi:hypothetical protein
MGHPVGVTRQVFQHLFRPANRRLGVDDPLGLGAGGELALKLARVPQRPELAVEGEFSLLEGLAQQCQNGPFCRESLPYPLFCPQP